MTVVINRDIHIPTWTCVAYYMHNPRRPDKETTALRDYIVPDDSPLQLGEANELWREGLLLKANRVKKDRTEIVFKSTAKRSDIYGGIEIGRRKLPDMNVYLRQFGFRGSNR